MKICVVAIAKMEEPYIREWIEWNKSIHIDHIVIGDNNDSDYDKPLQPIIQDYIDDGYVELINKNDVLNVQLQFYNDVYKDNINRYDWFTFIDIDEFIELPAYNNDVHEFLNDNKFDNYDTIILPWLLHTDSEQIYYEDKPVRERFPDVKLCNRIGIKYFVRGNLYQIEYFNSFHNPLNTLYFKEYCKTHNNYELNTCDSLGDQNFVKIQRNDGPYDINKNFIQIGIYNKSYYDTAYISHYITKSTEEYIKYKMLRGRCDRAPGKWDIRYNKEFYFNKCKYTKTKEALFNKYEEIINEAQLKEQQKYE